MWCKHKKNRFYFWLPVRPWDCLVYRFNQFLPPSDCQLPVFSHFPLFRLLFRMPFANRHHRPHHCHHYKNISHPSPPLNRSPPSRVRQSRTCSVCSAVQDCARSNSLRDIFSLVQLGPTTKCVNIEINCVFVLFFLMTFFSYKKVWSRPIASWWLCNESVLRIVST